MSRRDRACLADRKKIRRLLAGAADEDTTDFRQREDGVGTGGFDRPAIQNAQVFTLSPQTLGQAGPDVRMHFNDLFARWYVARSDRPERLVGDHRVGRRHAFRHAPGDLITTDGHGVPCQPLFTRFTDADDCQKTCAPRRFCLPRHDCIGLRVMLAAFRMPNDDRAGAGPLKHLCAEVAGKSPRNIATSPMTQATIRLGLSNAAPKAWLSEYPSSPPS